MGLPLRDGLKPTPARTSITNPWGAVGLLTPDNTPGPAFKTLLLDGSNFMYEEIRQYFTDKRVRVACHKLKMALLSSPYRTVVSTAFLTGKVRLDSTLHIVEALKDAFPQIYEGGLFNLRPPDAGVLVNLRR